MSVLRLFGISALSHIRRKPRARTSLSRRRLGFETMEGRRMLSAVNIDRSQDPAADTISVSASGSNTIVDVNGVQVYSGASSSISSLNITGSSYNDIIEFNYAGGNPVPNGSIGVSGGGGTNELEITANANFTLASYVQLFGGISAMIDYGYIQKIVAVASSTSDQANVLAADSSAGVFYGHLEAGFGQGTGDNFQANDGSYDNVALGFGTVNAISSNGGDVAKLDDFYAGVNNAVGHPTVSWFGATGLSDAAHNFATVDFYAGDTQDVAYLDDYQNSNAAFASYSPMNATYSGPGYNFDAANFTVTQMTGYNASDAAALSDSAAAPGTFNSYPTYSDVVGTGYGAYADVTKVYDVGDNLANDRANWYDTLGGAHVELNSSGQAFILFSNGANVTAIDLPPIGGGDGPIAIIYAYNNTNPTKQDYANSSALYLVTLVPNDSTGNIWWVNWYA